MIRAAAIAALFALPFARPSPLPVPLGALPSIPRVRLEVGHDRVVVVQDVDLPRGDWRGGDLDVYVAFGAPPPEAFDAHLLPVADGALEADPSAPGEKLVFERSARRGARVHELVGREDMAGVTVHVPDAAFRRAVAPGGMAALRFRTLLRTPDESAGGAGREVLVRLGATASTPLTLGRIEVAPLDSSTRVVGAAARLCGPDADPWPLAVRASGAGPSSAPNAGATRPVAPVLAVRHASDDLCVRFWSSDAPAP
jgi:hypothetical protein